MLSRSWWRFLPLLIVIVVVARGVLVASAGDNCPPGLYFDGAGCIFEDHPDENEDPVVTGCTQQDPFVYPAPCEKDGYEYVAVLDRYLRPLDADRNERYRPPDGSLSHLGYWEGDPSEGWIYEWRKLAGVAGGIHWGDYGYMWLAEAPGEEVVVVDPEEVARQVLDGMGLEPVEVGLAPRPIEAAPQSIGLVGAPVWMWVGNAGPTTWGPVEEAVTVGGVTVTVVAEVGSVSWDMGDGAVVECETPGEVYEAGLGVRASPSCGHVYRQTSGDQQGSAYAVTATANWTATWSASTGESGQLEPPRPATTAHVRIGERQVIEVG